MGKFGWDLPPGVSVRDLPGNSQGEAAAEAFWDKLFEKFPWLDDLSADEYGRVEQLVDCVFELGVEEGERRAGEALADKEAEEAANEYDKLMENHDGG